MFVLLNGLLIVGVLMFVLLNGLLIVGVLMSVLRNSVVATIIVGVLIP
jgi:hypothetical protein